MAKKSKIAELVVGFVSKGTAGVLASLKSVIGAAASSGKMMAGIGAALFTGFLAGAAQGTVEGAQFADAIRLLALTVANDLAPALRIAVAFVLLLIDKYNSLDQSTKDIIAVVGIAAAVVTGLSLAFAALAPVIGFVVSVITALGTALIFLATNPIGMVVLAIGAVVAAMTMMAGSAEDLAGVFQPVFKAILQGWEIIKFAVKSTFQVITNLLWNLGRVAANALNGRELDDGLRAWNHATDEMVDHLDRRLAEIPKQAEKMAKATAEKLMGIKNTMKGVLSGEGLKAVNIPGMGDLKQLFDAAKNPLRVKVQVSFESNQQVWESIQKGLLERAQQDPRLDGNLNDIKDKLDRIIGNTGKQVKAAVIGP